MYKNNQAPAFLSLLFEQLNKNQIVYCILRNYEGLPEIVGNDLDIWVAEGQQKQFQMIVKKNSI